MALGAWTGEAIGFQQQEAYARRFLRAFGSPNYFSAESLCFASRYLKDLGHAALPEYVPPPVRPTRTPPGPWC